MPNFEFEVEYAKSGRAGCKQCKGKIDKDLVRVGIKAVAPEGAEGAAAHMGASWYHFGCFAKAKGQAWFKKHLTEEAADAATGLDGLRPADREAVETLFKACRGEVPVPAAPVPLENDQVVTPAKGGKKRKGKAGEAADDGGEQPAAKAAKTALSDAQAAAIEDAKAKLAGKNAAFLGAALTKNGLPKAGRKDELVERVAEMQVLGVTPTCPTCEKKKLLWNRETGKFSCPGYFDDEAKAFKRCKGPAEGAALERTPWQDP